MRPYATQMVPVANTLKISYSEFDRTELALGAVLDLWEKGQGDGLYIKDWHLFEEVEKAGRGVEEIYDVPECFRGTFDW